MTYILLVPPSPPVGNSFYTCNSFVPVYFSGNHTFAAIRGKESYQLVEALSFVIGEINSLVTSETLAVLPGVRIEVVLGGDYKVNIHALINTSGVASRI